MSDDDMGKGGSAGGEPGVLRNGATAAQAQFRRALQGLGSIPRISWRDLLSTLAPVVLIGIVAIGLTLHFVQPAPPRTVTIAGGLPGSAFERFAQRYQEVLKRSGITVKVQTTAGSLDNLSRLHDPQFGVDVAFVQGGSAGADQVGDLVSLGSVFYEPLFVFVRDKEPVVELSQLRGRRISVGVEGSGARVLALALLKANGIEPGGKTTLLDLDSDDARAMLLDGRIDAAFLMTDSASSALIRELEHAPGIRMVELTQADAYVRRFRYLTRLDLPAGAFDLGENLPPHPVAMLAPTVELVARPDLHPAISDLLIETARQVHGRAGLLHTAGQFPAPIEHEFPISEDAARFYKTGKTFAYRHLPFWLASLTERALAVLVPLLVVLVPGLRIVPTVYSWRIRARIHRRYGELMALERATLAAGPDAPFDELRRRLDDIERAVIRIKMPGAFADQLYVLRQHIGFVRERLASAATRNGQDTSHWPAPPIG